MVDNYISQNIGLSSVYVFLCESGEVPTPLKSAKVTPVFKDNGSPTDYDNYRRISCIPHSAKIMENVIIQQLKVYIFDHEFITGDQSA